MRINLYSQLRHLLIVDGVQVTGFKEGDWLQIKKDGNAASRTHGGDGPSMNFSSDQGGQITFGLNPTSPALGTLYQLRENQKSNPRLFGLQVVTGVEEIISASGCGWGELPQFSTGGDRMQGRDLVLEALQIDLDTSALEAIANSSLI